LTATFLIFSFIGTGTSFLAFAVIAEKHGISSAAHGQKAFFLSGRSDWRDRNDNILYHHLPVSGVLSNSGSSVWRSLLDHCCRPFWFSLFFVAL